MRSLYSGMGYILNDNSASGGKREEADLLGCAHCHALIKKGDWKSAGGMCMVCASPLCLSCYKRTAQFGCEGPYEKKIEQAVNDLHRKNQNSRIMGI